MKDNASCDSNCTNIHCDRHRSHVKESEMYKQAWSDFSDGCGYYVAPVKDKITAVFSLAVIFTAGYLGIGGQI